MSKTKIKETYTKEQVSKIIKNIFIHLNDNMVERQNEFTLGYYNVIKEEDLNRIEKHWVKKYD